MTTAPAQPASIHKSVLARHPLVSYFVMAYAFSWIVWSPWVLGKDGVGLLPIQIPQAMVGYLNATAILCGPTVAALIMTGTVEGRTGIRTLLGRLVLWRVGIQWYLFALLGVPLIMIAGSMVYSGDLPKLGALGGLSFLPTYLYSYLLVVVLGGPLFEEIGWRGFALPRLEGLHGPLLASLILGILWALWHLPEFLVPRWSSESGGFSITSIILFTLVTLTFTFVITWVFNNTRASILIAILVHASIDTFSETLGAIFPPKAVASAFPMIIGFGVVTVVLIVVTRGRLSYERLLEAQPAPRVR